MKYQVGATFMITGLLLAGCGTEEKTASTPKTETVKEQTTVLNVIDARLKEPAKDERCAFCNMKVYAKDHKMGIFTAQAIDENGKNLFFDDAGCMLNYEREHDVKLEKFVRDHETKQWMKLSDAVIVQADIHTPMNYGFAYFKDEAKADAFIERHEGAKVVEVAAIDDKAHAKMKMKMKQSHEGDHEEKMDMDAHQ
ncbi:nitrous oxide reductase accessory protein NosL [Kurthia massiliensis]|uniref:nitrous oxide reductase accessory protein NosL n=1 Tax=Kurthia massiliensis TaxID=1033739 RepID=UPI0002895B6E|nr:nitrous oxide reductase accessory protein NosL [Kurthia massiliensis]